ncbi:MAG: hypothetical protein RIQ48_732 [Pseudomonadota bacterium]|jgi:NDP-sugar pyrophosphorylase family protein
MHIPIFKNFYNYFKRKLTRQDQKLNVLIPMAGDGKRFSDAGYNKPKPFIQINGKRMVEIVLENIVPKNVNKIILITRRNHNTREELKNSNYNLQIIELEKLTGGSIQTILYAEEEIQNHSLIVANCDQKINFDVNDFITKCKHLDGGIVTFKSKSPNHSYVKVNKNNIALTIIEKEVISDLAVSGVYYFKKASQFIEASKIVIKNNITQKGEFYISSALKIMIEKGLKLGVYNTESIILGTPEELQKNIHLL